MIVDPLGVGRKAHHTGVVWAAVDHATFAQWFGYARQNSDQIREATSDIANSDVDPAGTLYILTTDARSGFAVRPDGELVYVFSTVRGRGDAIVAQALNIGADHLDCFDGYLTSLYNRWGFIVERREANWTPGGPDVVYMAKRS